MIKYSGSNSLTKLIQLIKSKFDSLSIVRGNVSITQNTSTINIPITITDSSKLTVYHNGILLIPNEHYTMNGVSQVILLDYIAENGDVISFVYHNM